MNNNTEKFEAIKEISMNDLFIKLLSRENALFNVCVLIISQIVSIIITLRELFSVNPKSYQIDLGFGVIEIYSYQISYMISFASALFIIHGNKILKIITDNAPAIMELLLHIAGKLFGFIRTNKIEEGKENG